MENTSDISFKKEIRPYESIIPENFDGQIRFTNWTDSDFKAVWDSVEYNFPANKTTPMIVMNATPLEIQHIRKKFAKELATAELYKTAKFKSMDDRIHGQNPAIYTDSDLAEFTQRCLEPLEIGKVQAKALPKKGITISDDTRILEDKEDLRKGGTVIA